MVFRKNKEVQEETFKVVTVAMINTNNTSLTVYKSLHNTST